MSLTFGIGQHVHLKEAPGCQTTGTVCGIWQCQGAETKYQVRYYTNTGAKLEEWFLAAELAADPG